MKYIYIVMLTYKEIIEVKALELLEKSCYGHLRC